MRRLSVAERVARRRVAGRMLWAGWMLLAVGLFLPAGVVTTGFI